jgi:hypothetical protein
LIRPIEDSVIANVEDELDADQNFDDSVTEGGQRSKMSIVV